jgi:hypothetical protein
VSDKLDASGVDFATFTEAEVRDMRKFARYPLVAAVLATMVAGSTSFAQQTGKDRSTAKGSAAGAAIGAAAGNAGAGAAAGAVAGHHRKKKKEKQAMPHY